METQNTLAQTMSPEELQEFEAFQKQKREKEEAERKRQERENYKIMINELVNDAFPRLQTISEMLSANKMSVLESFKTAIELKTEMFRVKDEQRSHTFSNDAGNKRITIGVYTTDSYLDTANEGEAIVKEVITSLGSRDEQSKAIVEQLLRLLSKDKNGNLKPGRVIQMRELAKQLNNDRLFEGINIIEEAYRPQISKTFVKAERKNNDGSWVNIPLGITES